jgi:hypothetical protein
MSGACFTISSLGGIGGTYFSPIINAPEVAILGVNKSAMKPVWNGREFAPRLVLPLSLTADHRVIDGALATRFNVYLAQLLADMRRVKRVVRQGGVSIVLPVTSDGRHCDYAPSLMLALTRNLADVKDPPKVQEDPETKRMREAHFARRRAMREGMVTA